MYRVTRSVVKEKLNARKMVEKLNQSAPSTPVKVLVNRCLIISCFFCNESADLNIDHQASTFVFHKNVRHMANTLQDRDLIGKLSKGDNTAIDAVCHRKSDTALYTGIAHLKESMSQLAKFK